MALVFKNSCKLNLCLVVNPQERLFGTQVLVFYICDSLAPQIPDGGTLSAVSDDIFLLDGWEEAGLVVIFLEKFSVSF